MDVMVKIEKEEKQYKKSRIIFIMDRSGSMASIKSEAEGGFNSFVEDQAAEPGEATLTLINFDDKIETVHYELDIKHVPKYKLHPRGMTALYDAIGVTVTEFLATDDPDVKTIVQILTDGEENSSKKFTQQSVKALLEKVQAENGWDVLFVGANIDSKQYAQGLGISGAHAADFSYDSNGAKAAMKSMSLGASSLRGFSKTYADGTVMNARSIDMTKVYADASVATDLVDAVTDTIS